MSIVSHTLLPSATVACSCPRDRHAARPLDPEIAVSQCSRRPFDDLLARRRRLSALYVSSNRVETGIHALADPAIDLVKIRHLFQSCHFLALRESC